jgi:type IV secretory pathway VirJ component
MQAFLFVLALAARPGAAPASPRAVAARPAVGAPAAAPAPAAAQKLPLVYVPATGGTSDTLVVFISGDGGWAAIDKAVAGALAQHGLPVVGLNALQYFWTKRTPETAARDLQIIIASELARSHKSRVLLVGYSRGADVLPAMINRLAVEVQQKIRLVALLGPSPRVEFQFHVTDWIHDRGTGLAVEPEVEKLKAPRVLCLWGEDDKESLCPRLAAPNVRVVTMKGAHHFDGGYEKLAQIILEQLQ